MTDQRTYTLTLTSEQVESLRQKLRFLRIDEEHHAENALTDEIKRWHLEQLPEIDELLAIVNEVKPL